MKSLLSQSLRERQDNYTIQRIFEQYLTTSELLDATEQQLTEIKGIGMSKVHQVTAMLKLAKALTVPNHEQYIIDVIKTEIQRLRHERDMLIESAVSSVSNSN